MTSASNAWCFCSLPLRFVGSRYDSSEATCSFSLTQPSTCNATHTHSHNAARHRSCLQLSLTEFWKCDSHRPKHIRYLYFALFYIRYLYTAGLYTMVAGLSQHPLCINNSHKTVKYYLYYFMSCTRRYTQLTATTTASQLHFQHSKLHI